MTLYQRLVVVCINWNWYIIDFNRIFSSYNVLLMAQLPQILNFVLYTLTVHNMCGCVPPNMIIILSKITQLYVCMCVFSLLRCVSPMSWLVRREVPPLSSTSLRPGSTYTGSRTSRRRSALGKLSHLIYRYMYSIYFLSILISHKISRLMLKNIQIYDLH